MAVVTGRGSRGVQSEYHLVPIQELAQAFWEPHDGTFRQRLELLDHLLPLVHRVETMDPKHDFDLHLQWQHITERTVLRVD